MGSVAMCASVEASHDLAGVVVALEYVLQVAVELIVGVVKLIGLDNVASRRPSQRAHQVGGIWHRSAATGCCKCAQTRTAATASWKSLSADQTSVHQRPEVVPARRIPQRARRARYGVIVVDGGLVGERCGWPEDAAHRSLHYSFLWCVHVLAVLDVPSMPLCLLNNPFYLWVSVLRASVFWPTLEKF